MNGTHLISSLVAFEVNALLPVAVIAAAAAMRRFPALPAMSTSAFPDSLKECHEGIRGLIRGLIRLSVSYTHLTLPTKA